MCRLIEVSPVYCPNAIQSQTIIIVKLINFSCGNRPSVEPCHVIQLLVIRYHWHLESGHEPLAKVTSISSATLTVWVSCLQSLTLCVYLFYLDSGKTFVQVPCMNINNKS